MTILSGLLDDGAAPQGAAGLLVGLLDGAPERLPNQVSDSDIGPSGASLLRELNAEFIRAVRDPRRISSGHDWQGVVPPGAEPAPTLDTLKARAGVFPLLRDILQPREDIDRTIDRFEAPGLAPLVEVERQEEVLGLFAPELARLATPLPSLTRREHHALSPDSHVRIGGTTP